MSTDTLRIGPAAVTGQQTLEGHPFPLVLGCEWPATLDAVTDWVAEHGPQLGEQAARHGAILFRGFPLATAEDFDRFVAAFGWQNFPYDESLSNAVRVNRTPRVFTANEAPPSVTIFLHHEMAQTPVYPGRLFFFCEQPADEGGATPLCRSDVLWQRLVERCPEFARNCVRNGLRYSNVMPSENDPTSGMGRSWQSTLRAETREQAEDRLQRLGYSWQWL
ncbi:MAG TPA: TauD/TfdA family dioxygenase, partial [Pirellulales bacterium]|nr:TauD/TfdA family dioxygenase [Pirellulales bacterium]